MIGRTLGNYRIVEQIGLGGMATVYKAYDPSTDRYVAIKILPEHFSQDPKFRERFEREAKAIAKLEHIHILPIFAYGEADNVAYMAMRYLQAGTLTDRIKQGPLPLAEASRLLSQIASALDHAHALDILHRDVKPSNVLLDAARNAFLTDFGIAKIFEATLDLTGGGILGTPAYMSPEQCRGNTELTPASDQYSLGIVLYEMVTGRTPFQAETPIALIHMQLNEALPPPRQLRPELPEAAEQVILKALTKEPDLRYPSCGSMAAAFAQAVAGQPVVEPHTLPDEAPVSPTLRAHEATLPHGPTSETAAAIPSRGVPRWLWPVVALLGIGVIGAAIFFGLSRLEGETSPAEQDTSTIAAIAATPQTSESDAGPPPAGSLIEPCVYSQRGSGLCIFSVYDDSLTKLLPDADFADIGGGISWSPDGSQIVFSAVAEDTSMGFNLYIVNPDGSNLTQLPLTKNVVDPAWSPDGEWLTFHYEGQLAMMRSNGSDLTVLWDSPGGECAFVPQWSPDSHWIVVSMQISPAGCEWLFPMTREIWVISRDTGDVTPVAAITHENEECVDVNVAFSPDGAQVAYVDADCQPHIINSDGSGPPIPVEEFPYDWTARFFPQWGGPSEEPKPVPLEASEPEIPPEPRIVELCQEHGLEPGVCIYSLHDDSLTPILEDTDLDFERFYGYTWSPDGEQIAFSGARPEDELNSLYIMYADGSNLTDFPLPGNVVEPAWSPDGEWLALHYSGQLAMVRPDGSELIVLWDGPDGECVHGPQWSPDSEWIVVSMQIEPPHCEYFFPMTREVWAISRDGEHVIPIVSTSHENEECAAFEVAASPEGEQLAYVDDECQALLINVDGYGEPEPLDEFPWWWTARFFPQWLEEN